MTHAALSLAILSTPSGKYTARRKERIATARAWADANDYSFQLSAPGEAGIYSGTKPALGVFVMLQQGLQEGRISPGAVLILDDFSDLSESDMRSAVPLLMTLVQHGMGLVTLRDGKLWDARSMGDLGGFMFSVILSYAPDLDAHMAAKRARLTRENKKRLAAEGGAK